MADRSTQSVVDHHLKALQAGDVDEVLEDYTDDSVLITNLGGVVKGLDALRTAFGAAGALRGFEERSAHVEGDLAYITWTMDGITLGTDTFVLANGKIVMQTATIVPA